MKEKQEDNIIYIYYYFTKQGKKLWSPNELVAHMRADEHGTTEVYREEWIKPSLI